MMPNASLTALKKGCSATVTGLAQASCSDDENIRLRLLELGFVSGERVRVIAEGFPGRDPIAVRLGTATFALRRHEAAMVHIDLSLSHA